MKKNWTDEQLAAIEARNSGLVVSAAAGSGKTAVLVERVTRRICTDVSAREMVIVTFTNDAAAQIKNRLALALRQRSAEEPANEWLCRQQAMLGSAKISTISAFCFDLIRDNINLLDVSPGFGIIESADEQILIEEASTRAISDLYSQKPDAMKILSEYFCIKTEDRLKALLNTLCSFSRSIPFCDDYFSDVLQKFHGANADASAIADEYGAYLRLKLCEVVCVCARAAAIVDDCFPENAEIYRNCAEAIRSLSELAGADPFACAEKIREYTLPTFKQARKPTEEEKLVRDEESPVRAELSAMLKDIKALCLTKAEMSADYGMCARVLSAMLELFYTFDGIYTELKREKGCLSFSDGEMLALKLLSDRSAPDGKTPLARELSDSYKIIAIDEYQDVNDVQNLIFELISQKRENIFAVGDVKQSIYRFRNANPEIFRGLMKQAMPYSREQRGGVGKISLSKNFRSSRPTVDFINLIFGALMTEECGGIDYRGGERLVFGAAGDDKSGLPELLVYPVTEPRFAGKINCEARAVAGRIAQMLSNGETVFDKGVRRPCRCGDFCILTGTNDRAKYFSAALAEMGIKASSVGKKGYLQSREIMLMRDYLRIIDNPLSDISMAAVALSPLYMLTPEEISQIRLCAPSSALYTAMLCASESANGLAQKAKRLLNDIACFRRFAACNSLTDLIRRIYSETDFLSLMLIYSDGEQKKANLQLLINYAASYEKTSFSELSGFLRYLSAIEVKGGLGEANIVSGTDDIVAIKTIHASKGLEYPFVFICGASKGFNRDDGQCNPILHRRYGIGLKYISNKSMKSYDTFSRRQIADAVRAESQSEELRLLYVALTRAQERVFVAIGNDDGLKKRIGAAGAAIRSGTLMQYVSSTRCFEDWIVAALLTDTHGKPLRDIAGIGVPSLTDVPFSVNFSSSSERYTPAPVPLHGEQEQDGLVNTLRQSFSFEYKGREHTLPSKLSVTELNGSASVSIKRPAFASEKLVGADRGSAVHLFMQNCDFKAARASFSQETDRLLALGFLDSQQAQAVDKNAVLRFVSSPLCERICESANVFREKRFQLSLADIPDSSGLWGKLLPNEYKNAEIMLQGIIDCIFEEDDGFVIIDYKTDSHITENELVLRYSHQLALYCACAGAVFAKPVKEAYIWSFGLGRALSVPLDI